MHSGDAPRGMHDDAPPMVHRLEMLYSLLPLIMNTLKLLPSLFSGFALGIGLFLFYWGADGIRERVFPHIHVNAAGILLLAAATAQLQQARNNVQHQKLTKYAMASSSEKTDVFLPVSEAGLESLRSRPSAQTPK
ncbi:hypothetical protein DIPPA_14658 [Diplonema papillatum]|nr:hypothetical protein DIPPA_14658 [Diplonema papillatum]